MIHTSCQNRTLSREDFVDFLEVFRAELDFAGSFLPALNLTLRLYPFADIQALGAEMRAAALKGESLDGVFSAHPNWFPEEIIKKSVRGNFPVSLIDALIEYHSVPDLSKEHIHSVNSSNRSCRCERSGS